MENIAGQGKVMELLKKNKDPMSADEVAKKLSITMPSAAHLLRALVKHNEATRIKIKKQIKTKVCGGVAVTIKRRTYVYCCK